MKATRRDRYIKGIDSKSVLLTLFSPIPSDNVTIDTFPFTDMYAVHCAGDQVVRLTACDNAKKKEKKSHDFDNISTRNIMLLRYTFPK